MQSLNQLLSAINGQHIQGERDQSIAAIEFDSRKAKADNIFVCIVGSQANGHLYVEQAYAQGCRVFITQEKVQLAADACVFEVKNTSLALAQLACAFYGNPSKELKLVGVTGTNGKTTTATLLHDLFTALGYKAGLLSTVVNKIEQDPIVSTHTTPDPVSLNALLRQMVNTGCTHCFMEVSSHAIDQQRIGGLHFVAAGFTNITHDHLDYHHTFAEYLKVKKAFFDGLDQTAFALVNADDRNGSVMLQNTKAMRYTYAMKQMADFTVKVSEHDFTGMQLHLNDTEFWSPLIGGFNAYNLCAVYATAFLLTDGDDELPIQMSALGKVNGRFEVLRGPQRITAIVDYAHTPDALKNVLQTINDIRKNSANLITVVGCGGNRDTSKRPEMARIAAEMSNRIIMTSDNPRMEDPLEILNQMEAGVPPQHYKKILKISDRKEAIKTACMLASPGDIILVAGKGHETYQDIQGVKHPFDDKVVVSESFKLIN